MADEDEKDKQEELPVWTPQRYEELQAKRRAVEEKTQADVFNLTRDIIIRVLRRLDDAPTWKRS